MTIEIRKVWGEQVVNLCREYNDAINSNDTNKAKEIAEKLLEFSKVRDWRLALRSAQALEKIGKANPPLIRQFALKIISDLENNLFLDKDARETVIIALRWGFPDIDPSSTTKEIIEKIKNSM
ncbi:MAG: hypothetical protein ACP6IY_12600 [Promethearchaeia archaeon]